jgi:PAT family beta-lactamase induction signal transducer AmpG
MPDEPSAPPGARPETGAAEASIAGSRRLRLTTLCALYVAQGVPWGFVTIALVAFLNERGVSRQETATLISMSLLPWTFKIFWGPIIDSFQFPAMGLRRPWIIFAQLMMAATVLLASTDAEITSAETLSLLVAVFFVHNCFASLQDVATDAMAMDLLEPEERGRVNGMMWGSKLVGISIGGAVLATVMVRWSLSAGLRLQALLILAIMLLPLCIRERAGERLLPWSSGRRMAPPGVSVQLSSDHWLARLFGGPFAVARELLRAFALPTTALAALVALLTLLNQGFHDAATPAVFTQTLGWTAVQYGRAQGIWGTLGKLTGALMGGYLCDRLGRRRMAAVGLVLTATTFFVFAGTARFWQSDGYPETLFLVAIEGAFALTQVSLFSLFMKISWTGAAATQFTLFMTLLNLGSALGPQLTRLGLADPASYLVCGVLAFAPLALLPLLRPHTVVERREAELVPTAPK